MVLRYEICVDAKNINDIVELEMRTLALYSIIKRLGIIETQ